LANTGKNTGFLAKEPVQMPAVLLPAPILALPRNSPGEAQTIAGKTSSKTGNLHGTKAGVCGSAGS
jgi:hypothetical protein